ncbi:glycerophosphodiester phosphodiesterase family protein [Alkalihalobacillus sp. BA299]|uniref:glycerophosphodiester phosphodiesterase family protein n=1 Tax=Alkalihalobacillus sp. BA299 TaxID=2815938 RepID=UPI001ADAAA80|nr:glycerophosphodiester phosphodiesterase family protein [Alkalihalobacillus sp. BA299]
MKNLHTEVIAHRGLSGLYPENTMSAFKAAAKLEIDGIEMDVQLTKDKVPVIIHDATLGRTTEGQGMVCDHTLKQIKSYSAGAWYSEKYRQERVPTLEEVFLWAQGFTFKLNLELKGSAKQREELWKNVKQLIDKYEMRERIFISSFDHVLIANIIKEDPTIETAIIVISGMYKPLSYIQSIGTKSFHYFYPLMIKEDVDPLIQAGIDVRSYTINEAEMIESAFQLGIQGIFTDYPHIALKIKDDMLKEE